MSVKTILPILKFKLVGDFLTFLNNFAVHDNKYEIRE